MAIASVTATRWSAITILIALTLFAYGRPPATTTRSPVTDLDVSWAPGVAGSALRSVSSELELMFDRTRAMAVLAEYRRARAEHDRSAEWCGVRQAYPRPLRPIRISRACLDNPLAKDCI